MYGEEKQVTMKGRKSRQGVNEMRMYGIMGENVIWNEHTGGMFSKSCNIGKEDCGVKTEVTWIYKVAGYIVRRMADANTCIPGKGQLYRKTKHVPGGKLDAKYTWNL